MNLFTMLERAARSSAASGQRSLRGRERTYAELRERSLRLANGLHGVGVRRATASRCCWATATSGRRCCSASRPWAPSASPSTSSCVRRRSPTCARTRGSTVLIVDASASQGAGQAEDLPATIVTRRRACPRSRTARLRGAARRRPGGAVEGPAIDDLAILYYSSGTTGLPKAAAHTHDGRAVELDPPGPRPAADRRRPLPRAAVAVVGGRLQRPRARRSMFVGGSSTLLPTGGLHDRPARDRLRASGATHALLVPTLLKQLLDDPARWSGCARRSCAGSCPAPSRCRGP